MKQDKINHYIEYLSAILILSYFFIHNIIFVQIGIIISLYLININQITNFIGFIHKSFLLKKLYVNSSKHNDLTISNSFNKESSKEDRKLTLAETIEELGFIPSLDKDDENKAA